MFTLKHVSARPPFNLRGLRLFHTCVGNFSNKRDELNDFRGDWRIVLSELINNHGRTSYLRKVFARTKAKRVFTAQVRMYIYIYIYIYTGKKRVEKKNASTSINLQSFTFRQTIDFCVPLVDHARRAKHERAAPRWLPLVFPCFVHTEMSRPIGWKLPCKEFHPSTTRDFRRER